MILVAMSTNEVLERFGKCVRDLRVREGLSQESLAEMAGIHRTYLSDVERGRRNVALENLVRIARALDVPPSRLLKDL